MRSQKPKSTRVALYLRVSKPQRNGKGQTPENQRPKLREFARAMGWQVVAEYCDEETDAKSDRAQFKAMMEAASRREFDVLAVWSLDRFSREGIGRTCDYLRRLTEYKVGFRSYSEPFLDTTSEFGELVTAIFAFFAAFERRRIAERTVLGLERARKQGERLGRPRRIVDYRRICDLRERGLSLRTIGQQLGVSTVTVMRRLAAR